MRFQQLFHDDEGTLIGLAVDGTVWMYWWGGKHSICKSRGWIMLSGDNVTEEYYKALKDPC